MVGGASILRINYVGQTHSFVKGTGEAAAGQCGDVKSLSKTWMAVGWVGEDRIYYLHLWSIPVFDS